MLDVHSHHYAKLAGEWVALGVIVESSSLCAEKGPRFTDVQDVLRIGRESRRANDEVLRNRDVEESGG